MKTGFKKSCVAILTSAVLMTQFLPVINIQAETSTDYRKLLDCQVFKNTVGGWSGSGDGELEVVKDNLPIDTDEMYKGTPSLRINVTKAPSWWVCLLTFRDWNTHDISQYTENGYLEFNVKGKDGGEDFYVGARDQVYERDTGESFDAVKPISDFIKVTTEWQHVKIPLKGFIDQSNGFEPKGARCVVFRKIDNSKFTAWVNDIKITSPDNEKGYGAIKVNQVGYLPGADKYALVTGFAEELKASAGSDFQVKKVSDGSIAYTGKLSLVKDYDSVDSGEKILKADFSALIEKGEYYISVAGLEDSLKFKIGDDIFKGLLSDASRYFFYQRQGIELTEKNAPDYPRQDKTPQDKDAKFESGKVPNRDASQGWYDAGDKGKYINNGSLAISNMFWAYEMFPGVLKDSQMNIPESGNGVVDILDEAKWELDWILKMQDETTGGFYARIQSDGGEDVNITGRSIKDKSGSAVDIKSTDDTACAAAILSHAYIMYKDINGAFADKCLNAAKKAWDFLEKNPENIQSPSGPYNISDDTSDRLWASASLYRTTGDEKYHTYFKSNYKKLAGKFDNAAYAHNWGNMWTTAFWCYLKASNTDSTVVDWIKTEYTKWLDAIKKRYSNNPWSNVIKEGEYFWGCNSDVMLVGEDALIGAKLLGIEDKSIEKMALSSLNWILGVNPLRKSFVSGYGEDSIKAVFHSIFSHDGKTGIPKGYLAGGPNAQQGKGLSRFAAKCYTEDDGDWVSNENCLNWNAPLVFMSAYANSLSSAPQSELKYGDVNVDGTVDSADYTTLRRYLLDIIGEAKYPQWRKMVDLNEDGMIDSADYMILGRYLVGKIGKLPYKN